MEAARYGSIGYDASSQEAEAEGFPVQGRPGPDTVYVLYCTVLYSMYAILYTIYIIRFHLTTMWVGIWLGGALAGPRS